MPADRVALLRAAFARTLADPRFLADANRQKLRIEPMTAEEVTEIVKETVSARPEIVAKIKAAMDPKAK